MPDLLLIMDLKKSNYETEGLTQAAWDSEAESQQKSEDEIKIKKEKIGFQKTNFFDL